MDDSRVETVMPSTIVSHRMSEMGLGLRDIALALNELRLQMRGWLNEKTYASLTSEMKGTGIELLKEFLTSASEYTGVDERRIVNKVAQRLDPTLAMKLKVWYESWKGIEISRQNVIYGGARCNTYLIYDDRDGDTSASIFLGYLLTGRKGIVLTRRPNHAISSFRTDNLSMVFVRKSLQKLFWISRRTAEQVAVGIGRQGIMLGEMPLVRIVRTHLERTPGCVVLIDCPEHLKFANDFAKTFMVLSDLSELVASYNGIFLIGLKPHAFTECEIATLESTIDTLSKRPRPAVEVTRGIDRICASNHPSVSC